MGPRRTEVGSVQDVLVEYDDTGAEANPGRNVYGGMEARRLGLLRPFDVGVDGWEHWQRGVARAVDGRADLFV